MTDRLQQLTDAIEPCLSDLQHYADTHGPGPDRRLAQLRAVLAAASVALEDLNKTAKELSAAARKLEAMVAALPPVKDVDDEDTGSV